MEEEIRTEMFWTPQPGPQVEAITCPADQVLLGGPRGGGKALLYQALISTPFGWTKLKNLKLGSQITNPVTGGVQRVIGIYPQGEKEFYKVTMDDGAQVYASGDHLWSFKLPNRMRPLTKKSRQREYAIKHLGAAVPDERWLNLRVGRTEDLAQYIREGFNPRIPLTEPVLYTANHRIGSVDPYLIGLYIGDGCYNSLTITSCDDEIRDYLKENGWNPVGSDKHTDGKPMSWALPPAKRKNLDAWLRNHGMRYSRSWEKFLPDYVLTAPIEFRVSLLQGLMDSDGYVDDRGRCYYTTTSRCLADDIQNLVRGLGGKAYMRLKHPTYTYKGEKKQGRDAYEILIQLKKTSSLFRLSRKKARCTDSWNGGYEMMQKVVSVEPVGKRDCACIQVDSVYGLFITNDFIVTHNTSVIVGAHIKGALKHKHAWNGLIIRRKYKEFREIRRQFDELILLHGLPAKRSGGETQMGYIKFTNGAMITLAAITDLEMADDFIGFAYTRIDIDEAPNMPFIGPLMDTLTGSLRSVHGVPCQLFLTGNPGGPGAGQLKSMFVPVIYGGDVEEAEEGKPNYVEIEQSDGSSVTISRVYIHVVLQDNKILTDNDPEYERRLKGIADANKRKAWVDGMWNVIIGQAFDFSGKNIVEKEDVIWPIPEHAPVFMTMDWGFTAPTSIGWWWVDEEGRVFRFAEWYTNKVNQPNVGSQLTDRELCEGILEREKELDIGKRNVTWILGPDCFKHKADYKGGGQGPATSDEFVAHMRHPETRKRYGNRDEKVKIIVGDAKRETKIRQFRGRLARPMGEKVDPMLMVYPQCKTFIRVIPSICKDDITGEYIEKNQEDHSFDESCHICQYYPIGVDDTQLKREAEVTSKEEKMQNRDTASRAAAREYMPRK